MATKDYLYLQSLLDQGGDIRIPDGVYTIDETLVIHDDTKLTLSFHTVIRLADNSDCIMMKNSYQAGGGVNHRIFVEGGIWDGNNVNQHSDTKPEGKPYFFGVILRFENVEDLTLRDITFKDPSRYAIQILCADRFTVDNITFDYNMCERPG